MDLSGEIIKVGNDLLRGEVTQFIRRRGVVRAAGPVVAVLQDNANAIELLHQVRDEAVVEMRVGVDCALSSKIQEYRPARLVIRSLEKVSLLVRALVMRRIASLVWEVVDLRTIW